VAWIVFAASGTYLLRRRGPARPLPLDGGSFILGAPWARIPALIAGMALEGIAGTVRWLGGLRVADVRVPTPGLPVIFLNAHSIALAMALLLGRWWLTRPGTGRSGRKRALDLCGPANSTFGPGCWR
jgi:hypothetical protein